MVATQVRNGLVWVPAVAVGLTIVDLTREENNVKSASSTVNAEKDQLAKINNSCKATHRNLKTKSNGDWL